MELKKTNRGFNLYEFVDRYGKKCSLQESSIATERCIWLGCDSDQASIQPSGKGWESISDDKIAEAVGVSPGMFHYPARMHLTQQQVAELLPILTKFAITGEIN